MSNASNHPLLSMVLIGALILGIAQILPEGDVSTLPPVRGLAEGLEEAEELQAPSDAMLAKQLYGSDQLPTDVFAQQAAVAAKLPQMGGMWELAGPTNIGGRILDIAVDPELKDTIYVAAASGGVWRSDDAGTTFEPAWPTDLTQAIGALTIAPDGTLYAGTGETGPGGGSMTYGGTGVYKSTDRGRTWDLVGLEKSSRIGRIVLGPQRQDGSYDIFVAASGPLYAPGGQRGLYKSSDLGETWDRVLRGDNETTGAVDIAIDPSNPQKVFAAMWDHLRQPDTRRYNGIGSGLYVSNDGGNTFTRTAVGILGPSPSLGRIGIAFAPSAPQTIYLTASGESGAYAGAYKSTNGGTTWTPIAHPNVAANNVVYGWWFGRVWVDPADANHVFHAGLYLAESKDGGNSWTGLLDSANVHADQHAMAWDPAVKDRVYLGNDGGVYRSDDNGGDWTFGTYQPYSQLYSVDVSEQDPSRIVAGLQDNGVNRNYNDAGEVAADGAGWESYVGGDGEEARINPADQKIVYGCYQYGECSVSYDAGNRMSSFTNEVISTRKNWLAPIEFDPANPSIVYTGGEIMSRSDNDARDWRPISGELSNGPGRETNPLFKNFGTLTTIAPAPGSNTATGTIYAGTDDGNLWFTHTGGATWTKATDADLPKAWVTRVEVDVENPQRAYVTYSGFRSGDEASYILVTTDGGRNWRDISGNLPSMPLNDVNIIGDYIVAAGDLGVFVTRAGSRDWSRLGAQLPLAPVNEIRYHAPTRSLYAATFGRGVYRTSVAQLD